MEIVIQIKKEIYFVSFNYASFFFFFLESHKSDKSHFYMQTDTKEIPNVSF